MGFIRSSEWQTVAPLLGALEGGRMVQTEVYDPEKSVAAGPVYLKPGDERCTECREVIGEDEFPGAPWANILAQQRLKYGHTYCRECLAEVAP